MKNKNCGCFFFNMDFFYLICLIFTFFFILYIVVLRKRKEIDKTTSDFYLYDKNDFPLNVNFSMETKKTSKYNILYEATKKAIEKINEILKFKLFVLEAPVETYKKIVTVQICCGYHQGCLLGFDGKGGILVHATYPPYRRVCIDCKDIDFSPLYLVIIHEFGHIIGLEHETNPNIYSIMQPFINKGIDNFTRHDVMKIKSRFSFL